MPVYKEYDQQELDRQYNNRLNAADHEHHLQQWEMVSTQAGEKYKVHRNIRYGELQRESLDIFPSDKANAKTLVFIHGGYWYKNDPSDFYLVAEALRPYDITVVLISYPLMPVQSLDQLVSSCRNAIGWVYQNISQYNGDPEQLYIAGHSAGGHLASMMMTQDWLTFDAKLNKPFIKGICAISGLYNLLPVQLCYVNEILQMDKEIAIRNSPVQLSPKIHCPIVLAVGGEESDEYKAQSSELYHVWSEKGVNVELVEIIGTNHFSVLTCLLDQTSQLQKLLSKLMDVKNK